MTKVIEIPVPSEELNNKILRWISHYNKMIFNKSKIEIDYRSATILATEIIAGLMEANSGLSKVIIDSGMLDKKNNINTIH